MKLLPPFSACLRLVLLGALSLLSLPACNNGSYSSSSFTQGFPEGSFSGTVLTRNRSARFEGVGFTVSDPKLDATDVDYRFLIFKDVNASNQYEAGVDQVVARSQAMLYWDKRGEIPEANYEWNKGETGLKVMFILTVPGGKTYQSYETLTY